MRMLLTLDAEDDEGLVVHMTSERRKLDARVGHIEALISVHLNKVGPLLESTSSVCIVPHL